MSSDYLATMITLVKNGLLAKHAYIYVPNTKQIITILHIFTKTGYIQGYTFLPNFRTTLIVFLKYSGIWLKIPKISILTQPSRPNNRLYVSYRDFLKFTPNFDANKGLALLSTSSGILTHYQAFHKKIGGEYILYVQ